MLVSVVYISDKCWDQKFDVWRPITCGSDKNGGKPEFQIGNVFYQKFCVNKKSIILH